MVPLYGPCVKRSYGLLQNVYLYEFFSLNILSLLSIPNKTALLPAFILTFISHALFTILQCLRILEQRSSSYFRTL